MSCVICVANKGDAVPTIDVLPPISWVLKGSTRVYTQNGVNLLLNSDKELEVGYRATKTFVSQFGPKSLRNHYTTTYDKRVALEANKKVYQQTVEELYNKAAGDCTD